MSNKLKLLVVTPDIKLSTHLVDALKNVDVFDIELKSNSLEALDLLKKQSVNLIITDLAIGEIDGWRFSRMVRSGLLATAKNTPIVLIPPTYCERIAETTARAYGIDAILQHDKLKSLPHLLANILSEHMDKSSRLPLLLVESNEERAAQIKHDLELGFAITNVDNCATAQTLIQQYKYAIVLIDATHGSFDRVNNFLQQLRIHRPNQAVVTIIDSQDADFAEQLLLLGVTDFIRLPFNHNIINKVCEQAARREDFMVSYDEFADKVEQLSKSQQGYKDLFSAHQRILMHLNTAVIEIDQAQNICFLNPAWEALTGNGLQSSLGMPLTCFFPAKDAAKLSELISSIKMTPGSKDKVELQINHKLGHQIWIECKLQSIKEAHVKSNITLSIDNIDERKQAEFSLQHLAHHDTLTNLHNRYFFDQQLNYFCKKIDDKQEHALLYIDLDHFKIINDSQGHQQGDKVLQKVAELFEQCVSGDALVCRLGGDEFAIILENTDLLDAHMIGESLCQTIEHQSFRFGEQNYSISCSIGLTQINQKNCDASECLKQADIALYVAKSRGRNIVHCYSESDANTKQLLSGITWAHSIKEALKAQSLTMHFQPIWCYKEQKVSYYEALVRLIVNDEIIYPNQFIPSLELVTDIDLLDQNVIEKTIALLGEYPELNKVAINLSAQAFNNANLLNTIAESIKLHNVSPDRLTFEITESASISNLVATTAMITQLQKIGCQFSIDDFGTGFSTFSYLKQLPANQVKIDGSFVKDMTQDSIDKALVNAIKDISHSLGKTCVAEYVEDEETFELLREIGVDYAQGYYIGKPVAAAEIRKQKNISTNSIA
ncbi:EAL domain-containing protein [Pseudoalteromonas sp. SSM20]|uniref:EAL domain-containing protein n=1 Tax=Pseudoalteromonas sp. SSM20 TaxID=3139394 RepID=UPI003BA93941